MRICGMSAEGEERLLDNDFTRQECQEKRLLPRAQDRRRPPNQPQRGKLRTVRDVNTGTYSGGGRGIRTPGTLTGSVVFKALQGWEEHRLLPIYPNKTGLFCT